MSSKKIICLALFILPVLGMLMVLLNFVSPISSTYVSKGPNTATPNIAIKESVAPVANEWFTKNVDGTDVSYKLSNTFKKCRALDAIIKKGEMNGIPEAGEGLTRVEFLERILTDHCIKYNKADIDTLSFADVADDNTTAKKVIKTAIDLGIANGYQEDGKKVFKADQKITKIEAVAMLFKLSGLELKEAAPEKNFKDVEANWKKTTASTAHHLGLVPVDLIGNVFEPDSHMSPARVSALMGKISSYYR